ncbi:MAG: YIP1 family protein [Desulfosarcina sp.]|nr:YIP1 family protein [Desulfobacterales bacterium]
MSNKIIIDFLELFKNIILHPAKVFQNMRKDEYAFIVYFLFLTSCLITFLKSFSKKKYNNNFFANQDINEIIFFFNIPQIQWVITLLSFVLFIFLIGNFCNFFLKRYNKKDLILCLLSISSVGILLHITFFVLHIFLSQQSIYMLGHIAFVWIICLSIIAIKNSQNTSYTKSIIIFILSGVPAVFIIGLSGLAPYSLWFVV